MEESIFVTFANSGEGLLKTDHSVVTINLQQDLGSHAVVIAPIRSVHSLTELSPVEYTDLILLIRHVVQILEDAIPEFEYILLFNKGREAGQSIEDIHFHIIQIKEDNGFEKIRLGSYLPDILPIGYGTLSAIPELIYMEIFDKIIHKLQEHEQIKGTPYNLLFDTRTYPDFIGIDGKAQFLFIERTDPQIVGVNRVLVKKYTTEQLNTLKGMFS